MVAILFFLGPFFVALLVALIVAVWMATKRESKPGSDQLRVQDYQNWLNFIAGYLHVAKSDKEKALIQRMLDDATAQRSVHPGVQAAAAQPAETVKAAPSEVAKAPTDAAAVSLPAPVPTQIKNKNQVDNASLLLYLGAFMFVAAASLFVAFGGQPGVVRMLVVLFVSLVFYVCGIALFRAKPKLRQVGQTFAGIGIVLAPLVGAAFYFYVFNRGYGDVIWAVTSVFCLCMYAHALRVFHTALLGYVFIFTLLSLFESGIGVIHAPVYYYGWGLATVGMALQLLHYWKGWGPELKEVSNSGAMLFVPVSVLVAIALFPNHGAGQLGISLLLASLYYGIEVFRATGREREATAIASQLAAVVGVMAISYGASKRIEVMSYALLAVNAAQLGILVITRVRRRLWHNFGTILLALVCLETLLALQYPVLLFVAIVAAVCTAVAMWLLEHRAETYAIAALGIVAAAYVAGQLTFGSLDPAWQSAAGFGAALVLLAAYLAQTKAVSETAGCLSAMAGSFGVAMMAVLSYSFAASPLVTLLVAIGLAATLLIFYWRDHHGEWIDTAGLVLLLPLFHAWLADAYGVYLFSTVISLAIVVLLALRFRRETLRYVSTALWLLLPVALAEDHVFVHWSPSLYAWSYLVIMAVMIFSRMVARGVIYLSVKVPMSSYAKNASLSYVVGYVISAATAVCISLAAHNSRLQTTLILAILTLVSILLARVVEKRDDVFAFMPVLLQAALLSGIRPQDSLSATYAFVFFSSCTAVLLYAVFARIEESRPAGKSKLHEAVQASVATSFVAPASLVFGAQSNWLMAVGLLVAGLLLAYHIRGSKRSDREMAGGIIVLAVWWLLAFAHVHELQAYTHTVVVLLGCYAYWRAQRGERKVSDQYLWWMIGVATVPLALQALSGGAAYGWWLLFEEVTIMLVGITINRPFVIRWGLYVTVAAVLYQLRTYGYAVLGLLALFLIGLAVYQIQRFSERK